MRCGRAAKLLSVGADRTRAVDRRLINRVVGATAKLKATVCDRALDERTTRLDHERPQEVHASQRRVRGRARHLEVANAREDDAALHDMMRNQAVKRASSGRTEENTLI